MLTCFSESPCAELLKLGSRYGVRSMTSSVRPIRHLTAGADISYYYYCLIKLTKHALFQISAIISNHNRPS